MEQLTSFFHSAVVHFGYAGLFLVVFLGNIGMPTGVEIVMPSAGALAATEAGLGFRRTTQRSMRRTQARPCPSENPD